MVTKDSNDVILSDNKKVLYADIGNSTIDFLMTDFNTFQTEKVMTNNEKEIFHYLSSHLDFSEVYISSVNRCGLDYLLSSIHHFKKDCSISILTPSLMKEYLKDSKIQVENIDILGGDLFCDIVAKENTKGQIVIDLGTASKILYLDPHSYFHGCMIFPGLSSFPETLHAKTDLLKNQSIEKNPPLVSLKTEECISSGVINGVSALVSKMVEKIKKDYHNEEADVILTGGNAYLIKEALKQFTDQKIEYDPYHILRGLVRISRHDDQFIK